MDLWWYRLGPSAEPEESFQPVTAGIGIRHAVLSPDGTRLAYSRGRQVANLWRVPILEDRPAVWADAHQLTFEEAFIERVDVSPDGESLVVQSDRSGDMDLWMLPRDGGEWMQVTSEPAPDSYPRWSPDGRNIAFYSNRTGNREIWVTPVSGGPARQLTDGKGKLQSAFATWSPDGREIAFSSPVEASINVMPSDGGNVRQMTATTHPAWPASSDWSPDGEWLVFVSDSRLWRVPAAGGNHEALTEPLIDVGRGGTPRWSMDGKRIFFAEGRNLWAVSPEDGTMQAMTELVGRQGTVSNTCMATDGEFLYFAWREDLGDIWVMGVVTEE